MSKYHDDSEVKRNGDYDDDIVVVAHLDGGDGDGVGVGDSVIVGDGDDIIVVVAHLGGGEEEGARLPSLPLPQTPRIIFHLGNIFFTFSFFQTVDITITLSLHFHYFFQTMDNHNLFSEEHLDLRIPSYRENFCQKSAIKN